MPHRRLFPLWLLLLALAAEPLAAKTRWPFWDSYAAVFLDSGGRIVDHDAENRTTSEGQAYGLFFSLVADDRPNFDRILSWTQTYLARGDLKTNLPAWLWANNQGRWSVADDNSASDADLWIAYTLLQAGRHWRDASLSSQGRALSRLIVEREVVEVPGLGLMLLPGPAGFKTTSNWYQFNASYLPAQVLLGIFSITGDPSWRRIADLVPRVVEGSSANGFILDWIAYRPEDGFAPQPSPASTPLASYDAIRVYLWAGMLAPATFGRARILSALSTMADYIERCGTPPAVVNETGQVQDANGGVGFSAAVIPLLRALDRMRPHARQMSRLQAERDEKTGLYGATPHYFDQNLALFALGWSEKRFYFDEQGRLGVNWK